MTIQVKERFESRSSRGTADKPTAERKFRVYDDAGTATITEDQAIHANGVPAEFDRHPSYPWLRVTWPPEVTQTPGKSYAWDLVFKYERLPSVVPDPGTEDPNAPGYTEINTSSKSLWVDGWRNTATIPNAFAINYPDNTTDIGGFSIDSQGEPASYPVHVSQADITHIVDSVPQFAFYAKFENTRNKTTYLGASPGKLLYVGNDADRTGESLWRVIHHFAYDEDYHLRQQPTRLDDNKPQIGSRSHTITHDDGSTTAFSWTKVASLVFHIQPYPKTMDFAVLRLRIR